MTICDNTKTVRKELQLVTDDADRASGCSLGVPVSVVLDNAETNLNRSEVF